MNARPTEVPAEADVEPGTPGGAGGGQGTGEASAHPGRRASRRPASLAAALTGNPLRFLFSWWPLRSLAYLAVGAACGPVLLVLFAVSLFFGLLLAPVAVGVPLLVGGMLLGIPMAVVERYRLRLVEDSHSLPLRTAHRPPAESGLRPWLTCRLRERATWRELAYALVVAFPLAVVNAVGLILLAGGFGLTVLLVVLGVDDPASGALGWAALGLVLTPVSLYLASAIALGQAALTRLLLSPTEEELGARVRELRTSRMRLADAFEAERRRIERDLHDGAQERLVALMMSLGMARLEMARTGDERGVRLVDEAHDQARAALTELRELVRGIHPRVLTDLGLGAAVEDLAQRCPVPVTVDVELGRRLPPSIEATAYFVVREALTNVVKHSRAERAEVTGRLHRGTLTVTVTDDGVGGASATRLGTGLVGLQDRVAVVDGRLEVTSPTGGPTTLTVTIPCPPPRTGDAAGAS
ncbi:sensor histidine kinase [Actinoalloteichus caeruleus]|uniref:sensor histidine kinase n=1 Tax=Actinoalloteichus cyanogriseus TaxID=2893586 RepID=UPI000405924C|nr:sensor histidine kinase [Actinoalloteichus caeruleus]